MMTRISPRMPEIRRLTRGRATLKKARPRKRMTARPSPNTASWRSQPAAALLVEPPDICPASMSPRMQARKKTLVLISDGRIALSGRRMKISSTAITRMANGASGLRKGMCMDSAQADDGPAVLASVGAQFVVRVDGDRRRHLLHQRQVVVRVAVEITVGEAAPPQAERFEPGFDAGDLAALEGGCAGRFS